MFVRIISLEKSSVLQLKVLLPAIAFSLPLVVSGPQLLTGSFVNCLLFVSASKLSTKNLWIVAVLPSIGALANGVLFGKYTPFLIYFLPIIWIGNLILMKTYQMFKKRLSFPLTLILSSAFKTLILYFSVLIYFRLHLVPKLFLVSMGMIQLVTALLGGILAYALLEFVKRKYERSVST